MFGQIDVHVAQLAEVDSSTWRSQAVCYADKADPDDDGTIVNDLNDGNWYSTEANAVAAAESTASHVLATAQAKQVTVFHEGTEQYTRSKRVQAVK